MKKAVVLVPRGELARFLDWLYARSEFSLEKFDEIASDGELGLSENFFDEDFDRTNDKIRKCREVVEAADYFKDHPIPFLDSLFPLKTVVSREEFEKIRTNFDLDGLSDRAADLRERMNRARREVNAARARIAELKPLEALSRPPAELTRLGGIEFCLVQVPAQKFQALTNDPEAVRVITIEKLHEQSGTVTAAVFHLPVDADGFREVFNRYEFREIQIPEIKGSVRQEIAAAEKDEQRAQAEIAALEAEYGKFSPGYRDAIVMLGFYETERARIERIRATSSSDRVSVVTGWVKAKDAEKLEKDAGPQFRGAEFIFEDPAENDNVPVALDNEGAARPAQLLVDMFGRPGYNTFDATKSLFLPFIVFFGICFGDVMYGIMLIAAMLWLRKRYRDQRGLFPFFNLFIWGGLSTIVFGAVTNSWASDLFTNTNYAAFLGPLKGLKAPIESITLIEPMSKPMVALGIALFLGILNQFWGIGLAFYQSARRGRWGAALADSAAWIIFLTGIILLPAGTALAHVLLIVGGLNLVIFQGRDIKNLIGRFLAGLVSIYGILGTYGVTSFVGDVLSYSRLLALGLTTMIAGMAFNILANLVGDLAGGGVIGAVLFWIIVIGGHVFNFLMCVLGSFVHSARLIFLEFFSRFYDGGAKPFEPYGFKSDKIDISKAS